MSKRFAAILPALLLPACGGGGSPTTAPPPTTLPPCVQTVILQASDEVPANTALLFAFSTSSLGRLDATVDWTFAATPMAVYIVNQATCDLATATMCAALVASESGPKPRRVSGFNAGPGSYWLVVVNPGSTDDAVSVQVVLSSPTCPTISGTDAGVSQVEATAFRRARRR
jgi:hypothetical protein